ncbi:MAG: two-component sensor histidine kinase, partial [Micromonosporaceae bacterium]
MRRRLAAIYVLLLTMVLAGLEVPLAITLAGRATQQMGVDRLSAVVRFATLAEPALRENHDSVIRKELTRYQKVYGVEAAVVNRDGEVEVPTSGFPEVDLYRDGSPDVDQAVRRALGGEHVAAERVSWPWKTHPMVVAAPVGTGGQVLGAVITVSSTEELRWNILSDWLLLAALGLIAVAGSVLAAEALARWTLKPVAELDAAAN